MSLPVDLNVIWFGLVGILLAGYAVLDGFDLGVGILYLLTKKEEHRRLLLNAIGPVWDGNEVWLVTGGGALFAAFPMVYATVFSGFYLPFMLLLFALIFRAVAIEFRSKHANAGWRRLWDVSFCVASAVASLLLGTALGDMVRGIPLDATHEFAGSLIGLLNPYALLVGITTVALFAMHGAIYVVLKTEGELHEQARRWVNITIPVFVVLYLLTSVVTVMYLPHMTVNMKQLPVLVVVPLFTLVAILSVPRLIRRKLDFTAFVASALGIVGLMMLVGIGLFPNMVISSPHAENSLTIYNAASSLKTLKIMLIIVLLGLPLVLAYTVSIYWIFRGKVKLDSTSY